MYSVIGARDFCKKSTIFNTFSSQAPKKATGVAESWKSRWKVTKKAQKIFSFDFFCITKAS